MAIKKRTPVDRAAQLEAIEAFGDGAERPVETKPSPIAQTVTQVPSVTAPSAQPPVDPGWPDGVAKTFLIRYSDPSMPIGLAELARLEDRSQHASAL
ncbi:hypothetical protein, partial [Plantibacter sp. CFBP 8775]|uniref:hypothetical protein n=1 Tax=Plantibacter sp. CFBP 8775 TaxID=2774038 RepID=UPI001A7ED83A